MIKNAIVRSVQVFTALILIATVCAAQGDMPPHPDYSAPDGASSDYAPTATKPQAGAPPQTAPQVSTDHVASDFGQGEPLSQEQVLSAGEFSESDTGLLGATGAVGATGTGFGAIRYWALYDGMWSYGPVALHYGQRTNMIVSNDQPQSIWSYEKYPGGYEVWKHWGYWHSGDYNTWFSGDAMGWHMVAIYGDGSGWSNPIWINVEPCSPYYVNGQPHPTYHGDWLSDNEIDISGDGSFSFSTQSTSMVG